MRTGSLCAYFVVTSLPLLKRLMPSIGLSAQSDPSGPAVTVYSPIDVVVFDAPTAPIAHVLIDHRDGTVECEWFVLSPLYAT